MNKSKDLISSLKINLEEVITVNKTQQQKVSFCKRRLLIKFRAFDSFESSSGDK